MDNLTVSIILPVLNESEFNKKIDLLIPYVINDHYEIIVVDDSGDDEFLSLKKCIEDRRDTHIRLIKGDRKGKGAAIKKAVLESAGSVVFYIDADFRISLDNIKLFAGLICEQGYDVIVAERPFNKTPRTPLRLFCSLALFYIVRLFVFSSTFFYDTQCGFKGFKGKVLRKFAQKQTINGGMFDIEYLYMARFNKFRIYKVPVSPLPEIRASRINLLRCMFHDTIDLLNIKIRGISGYYKIQR